MVERPPDNISVYRDGDTVIEFHRATYASLACPPTFLNRGIPARLVLELHPAHTSVVRFSDGREFSRDDNPQLPQTFIPPNSDGETFRAALPVASLVSFHANRLLEEVKASVITLLGELELYENVLVPTVAGVAALSRIVSTCEKFASSETVKVVDSGIFKSALKNARFMKLTSDPTFASTPRNLFELSDEVLAHMRRRLDGAHGEQVVDTLRVLSELARDLGREANPHAPNTALHAMLEEMDGVP